jgi:ABC-type Mn2+/Zn2+ transport system ATPase subunit
MIAVSIQDLGWKYVGRKNFAIEHVNIDIEQNTFVSVVVANFTATPGCSNWLCVL